MGIGEGDEIILSIMEHHSNIVPWHFLRERKGAVIKWVPVDDDGDFLLEDYERLFSPRTKIVAITHMSNVLGTVTPVEGDHPHRPCARRAGAGRRRARARSISTSTCATSMRISMSSPATRSMARPGSAFSTASANGWSGCRPIRAAAR